jgi:serine/threonine-protein kinase
VKSCPTCSARLEDAAEFCPYDGARLATDPGEASFIGQVLGERFVVERKLGQGTVGTVYRADDRRDRRPVAVKILNPTLSPGSAPVNRMLDDAQRASRLLHPNLVPLLDHGVHAERFVYLVEPLLEGQDLSHRVGEDRALTPDGAMQLGVSVLLALEALHRLEMLHLDLKPTNIFLLRDAFGLERAAIAGVGTHHLLSLDSASKPQSAQCLARPEYLCPEIVGGKSADVRSDVYNFGVVLYEALAGRPPFAGGQFTAAAKRHVYEKPLSLKLARPSARIPDALEALVLRCLNKSPGARYASAAELARALERLLGGTSSTEAAAASSAVVVPAGTPPAAAASLPARNETLLMAAGLAFRGEAPTGVVEARAAVDSPRPSPSGAVIVSADEAATVLSIPALVAAEPPVDDKGPAPAPAAETPAPVEASAPAREAAAPAPVAEAPKAAPEEAPAPAAEAPKAAPEEAAAPVAEVAEAAAPVAEAPEAAAPAPDPAPAPVAEAPTQPQVPAIEAVASAEAVIADAAANTGSDLDEASGTDSGDDEDETSTTNDDRSNDRKGKKRKNKKNRRGGRDAGSIPPAAASKPVVQSAAPVAVAAPSAAASVSSTATTVPVAPAPERAPVRARSSLPGSDRPIRMSIPPGGAPEDDGWFAEGTRLAESNSAAIDEYHRAGEKERSTFPWVVAGIVATLGLGYALVVAGQKDAPPAPPSTPPSTVASAPRSADPAIAALGVSSVAPPTVPPTQVATVSVATLAPSAPSVAQAQSPADLKRLAAQQAAERKLAEAEAKRVAAQQEAERKRAEAEAKRVAAEQEAERKRAEAEAKRVAAQQDAERKRAEAEAKRVAAQQAAGARRPPPPPSAAPSVASRAPAPAGPGADALVADGRKLLREARYADARRAFELAVKSDGRNASAHAGLGDVAFQEQKFPDAIKHHTNAVRFAPKNVDYLLALGMACFKAEKLPEAKSHWQKATQLQPGNEKAEKYLKLVERRLGN